MSTSTEDRVGNRTPMGAEHGLAGGWDRGDRSSAVPPRSEKGLVPAAPRPRPVDPADPAVRYEEFCTDWFLPALDHRERTSGRE